MSKLINGFELSKATAVSTTKQMLANKISCKNYENYKWKKKFG